MIVYPQQGPGRGQPASRRKSQADFLTFFLSVGVADETSEKALESKWLTGSVAAGKCGFEAAWLPNEEKSLDDALALSARVSLMSSHCRGRHSA